MAVELLERLRALGVVLSIDGDGRLAYDAPADVLGDELLDEMRAHRDELLALVRDPVRPRVVHLRRDAFDVRIDRSTKWGNPFRIGPDGDRAAVIEKYRAWIVGRPDLMAALPELRGKRLGCWCAPMACHGDVLADLVERLALSELAPDLGPRWIDPIPGVICPWCRLGDRLVCSDGGLDCDRCRRLAFRFLGDGSIERIGV
jgi:hypothetical protein